MSTETVLENAGDYPRRRTLFRTFKKVRLKSGQFHDYSWVEPSKFFKRKDSTLVTSEKVKPIRLGWFPSIAVVRYSLNGHEIETHKVVQDYNFVFDLCPTPTPEHPQDVIGKYYVPCGRNVFRVEVLRGCVEVLSLFVYRDYEAK